MAKGPKPIPIVVEHPGAYNLAACRKTGTLFRLQGDRMSGYKVVIRPGYGRILAPRYYGLPILIQEKDLTDENDE